MLTSTWASCGLFAAVESLSVYQWSLVAFATAYAFAFGATLGSFANVVVYRSPRGLNVIYPASGCPSCGAKIRSRDNIPVLSWLVLRGKCRDCRASISPRYMLLEIAAGCIVTYLLWLEVFSGGASLPMRVQTPEGGIAAFTLAALNWQLICIALFHALLLLLLLIFALVDADGHVPPRPLITTAWILGAGASMIWPFLILRQGPIAEFEVIPALLAKALNSLSGIAVGLLVAATVGWPGSRRGGGSFRSTAASWSCVGLFLSWHSVGAATLLASASLIVLSPFCLYRGTAKLCTPAVALACGAILHLATWRSLAELPYWPSYYSSVTTHVLGILAGAGLIRLVIRYLPLPPDAVELREPAIRGRDLSYDGTLAPGYETDDPLEESSA